MNLLRELRHSNVVIYMGACLEQARPPHSLQPVAVPGIVVECSVLINAIIVAAPDANTCWSIGTRHSFNWLHTLWAICCDSDLQ